MQSSDWSTGGEVKRHGRSGRERARATGSERGATAWGGQSCLGAVLFSSPRYCWPRFDATVTTWTWYSIYPWVRWAFRLLHRLQAPVKSEKNSTSTCCWPRANSVCARANLEISRREPSGCYTSWSWWKFVEHRFNSSVYPSSSLFPLLSLSYTWTRRERACFYDLLQNLREVKSCTTHSVRYAVCVRCDFTVRRATSRPHCNIIFRLLLGVCTREPGLEYTCLPWRGWFGSSNDLKVRFSWLHFLCYLKRVTW